MINALVCVKSIPDLDKVVAGDWTYGENLSEPDVSYVNNIMNSYDENAIELLLRLRDACNEVHKKIEIDVLTIGNSKSEKMLKNSYAVGADSCILIESEVDYKDNYHAVALILNAYVMMQGGYDIIMCGASAAPYDNGQAPFALSHILEIPSISDIQKLLPNRQGLKVVCKRNGTVCEVLSGDPFVGIAGNIRGCELRLPTLKERLNTKRKDIVKITVDDIGLSEQELCEVNGKELKRMFAEEIRKDCYYIDILNAPGNTKILEKMMMNEW